MRPARVVVYFVRFPANAPAAATGCAGLFCRRGSLWLTEIVHVHGPADLGHRLPHPSAAPGCSAAHTPR